MSRERITRALPVLLALAVALSVSAFGEVTLTLEFTDLAPHVGQALSLRIVDTGSWAEVARLTVPAVPSAVFRVDVSPFMEGRSYQVDYFLDQDGDGAYDAPPVDAAWRFFISGISEAGVVGVVHDAAFTDIDWPPLVDGVIEPSEYRHTMTEPATGIALSWQNDGAILYVGLNSPGTGWVGIGFDPVSRMQGANFILAAASDGVFSISDQFGVAQTIHRPDASSDVIQAAGREADGGTVVEFALPLASGDSEDKGLTPGQTVAVLLAYNRTQDSFTAKHTVRSATTITLDGGI